MQTPRLLVIPCFLAAFFTTIHFLGCTNKEPISVGFMGPLTGRYSDVGTNCRNGAKLFIEEVNAQGGIDGRPLAIIVEDDEGSVEGAIRAARKLSESGVSVIIGPSLSHQAVALMEKPDIYSGVFISPSVATTILQNKKDRFFRVTSSSKGRNYYLADYAYTEMGLRHVTPVGDKHNSAYVDTAIKHFSEKFMQNGGEIGKRLSFRSEIHTDWSSVVDHLKDNPTDAVFNVASSRDFASLAQELKLKEMKLQLLGPAWSAMREVLTAGGSSLEDAVFIALDYDDFAHPPYVVFAEKYESRFGFRPNFVAAFSYEAAKVLVKALNVTGGDSKGLMVALRKPENYEGVLSSFTLDEFGDANRPAFLARVEKGKFKSVSLQGQ